MFLYFPPICFAILRCLKYNAYFAVSGSGPVCHRPDKQPVSEARPVIGQAPPARPLIGPQLHLSSAPALSRSQARDQVRVSESPEPEAVQ